VPANQQLVKWSVAALCASTLLAGALVWQYRQAKTHWEVFLVGDPAIGARLFFGKEGCAHCHSVNGAGGKLAPDLGFSPTPEANLNHLVSAMWNHAPAMWDKMRAEKLAYPDLSKEEVVHLFAFLYTTRYADEPGDAQKGQLLFRNKGCIRCHTVLGEGGSIGPDLSAANGIDTPIRWVQAMWNHAPAMEKDAERLHLDWPHFEGDEMNDLLAFVRANSHGQRGERELLPASPDRGWKVFQSKSCIVCHSVRGVGGGIGPDLGPGRQLPLSIVQFAGLMWNHSPKMWRVPEARAIQRPTFQGRELADLVAFLATLRFFEPVGSSESGRTLFSERGCDHCHGAQGEGVRGGPALRGRGQSTTVITLATALWRHGPKMYQRSRELGRPWPTLKETDVADVLTFLNSPAKEARR
jgi:cytochrome c2